VASENRFAKLRTPQIYCFNAGFSGVPNGITPQTGSADSGAVHNPGFMDSLNYLDTVRTYDASNNTLTEKDPEGNMKAYTYDTRGNRLTETDPGRRTTTYAYSPGCDKVATITDPAGNVTTNSYDSQCNLRFVKDALGHSTEYRYNGAGQRTRIIDPNGTAWIWSYGANGLLESFTDPFGKATTFSFDSSGNLLSRTDRMGRRIDFQYDSANQLTREAWDTGRFTTYTYDAAGSLLSATDPESSLTMTYDNLGRLFSVDNLGSPHAPRVAITYSYDANGNTIQVQDSLGGITNYTYDALNHLSRVTQSGIGVQPKRVDITYSAASILTQLKRFGDLAGTLAVANTTYEYDCGGCPQRLTAIRHRRASDNSVIHDLTFVRDAVANVLSSTDAEGAHEYGFDAMRRLTSASHPLAGVQPNEFYNYDAIGNRLSSHLSHFYTYTWQAQQSGNRLLKDSQFDYSYDDEGNLIRKANRASGAYTAFTYDHRNRATTVVQYTSSGLEAGRSQYMYDSLNRRIRVIESGQEILFAYDGQNPMLKLASTGTLSDRRTYGRNLDELYADEMSSTTRWMLLDQIGSVRDVVANTGQVLTHYGFDSFGRLLSETDPSVVNDILFGGREFDRSNSLGIFRARMLDSSTARFGQEDRNQPFEYSYAANNPLSFIDPLGRATEDSLLSKIVTPTVAFFKEVKLALKFVGLIGLAATVADPYTAERFAENCLAYGFGAGLEVLFGKNMPPEERISAGVLLVRCWSATFGLEKPDLR
jgi:RHS repeat-associated protein